MRYLRVMEDYEIPLKEYLIEITIMARVAGDS